jgi:hypothetical protein
MARVLYESANGDVWRLIRDPQSGVAMVEHKPNVSSGGRTALIEIGQFLRAGANGPEHQALLKLIGTLVNDWRASRRLNWRRSGTNIAACAMIAKTIAGKPDLRAL